MPQGKSLRQWINIYEKKTGDKARLPSGFRLIYLADRGFASMRPFPDKKIMVVYQTCGDAKFWRDFAELMSIGMGIECICTICVRHIRPYIRGFGWEILKEECIDGQYRFRCQDSTGRLVVITHRGTNDDTGEPNYWVSHYIKQKYCDDFNGGGTSV